jgi:AraC family transcriptional regulator of adaptative response/methylated-DNA-[protein]-cysteine methyltransferase
MQNMPPASIMLKAFLERDSTFEGIFYTGVKTTGIFCRPTCSARNPKPVNVEFFGTTRDALYAGYRPCLMCKPMEREKLLPEVVKKLSRLIEEAPSLKITASELGQMGIDPSTARRQFQRCYA